MKNPRRRSLPTFRSATDEPALNMAAFVEEGRNLATLAGLDFDAPSWDVTRLVRPCPGRPRQSCRLNLRFLKAYDALPPLCPEMATFAKAYCANFLRRLGFGSLFLRLACIKHLGAQLGERPPQTISTADLDAAARTLSRGCKPETAHVRLVELELVAEFLSRDAMTNEEVGGWRSPAMDPSTPAESPAPGLGKAAASRAGSPHDPRFVSAMAKAFVRAREPEDVLVTGICTLMQFLPASISGMLDLDENCWRTRDDDGTTRILVRLAPEKDAVTRAVWVPGEMTWIAQEALTRMHAVTAEARAIKRWYDFHSEELYLPEDLRYLKSREFLTFEEAAILLGMTPRSIYALPVWQAGDKGTPRHAIRFDDVERFLLDQLDEVMFRAGGSSHHPLMLMKWRRGSSCTTAGSPCMFRPIAKTQVSERLTPRPGKVGMLQRLGVDPSGTIRVNTRSFRHNMVVDALRGGLGKDDMAEWLGRKDPWTARHSEQAFGADLRRADLDDVLFAPSAVAAATSGGALR